MWLKILAGLVTSFIVGWLYRKDGPPAVLPSSTKENLDARASAESYDDMVKRNAELADKLGLGKH